MALTKSGFKGQIGLQFGGELKNVWDKEKRRRRKEEEKEFKQKGMETEPKYGPIEF